ncbi:toll-like receptor 8 isoform X1 [Denticeps clupeoides]|uniref:toll-like receptor 8 isoform X1 n=1 Tax=Denticeps clupeoides TaxID=299321 RepID=UPI0010A54A84|nr:toll-like receptor 8 isoform X1 [Denticeps clupeoides]
MVASCWSDLFCWVLFSLVISSFSGNPTTKLLRKVPCVVSINDTRQTVTFNCRDQGLRQVPDGIFKNVTTLILANNKISSLPPSAFSNMYNLLQLDLSWNRNLGNNVVLNVTRLEDLQLVGAGLQRIPRRLPSGLQVLNLDQNTLYHQPLTRKSFLSLKKIRKLSLSKNCFYGNQCQKKMHIEDQAFSSLTHLKVLRISYNNLSCIPRGLPVSLSELELASNFIQDISKDDFSRLWNLKSLKLEGNCPRCYNAPYPCIPCRNKSINIDGQAFDNLTKLELLHLGGNSLGAIKSAWFKHLKKLKHLFLSFNFLSEAIAEGAFLTLLPNLASFDISFNYDLKEYPKTLRLSQNFSQLVSLKTFLVKGYVFQEIIEDTLSPLKNLKHLSVLNLGINFIVRIDSEVFAKLPNVKLIYLSENRLYPVTGTTGTTKCTGFTATATAGPINHLNENELLHSSRRFVSPVKPQCFKSGRVLDLSRNNIFFISPKQFEGFGNISCLNLSRNSFSAALNGTEFSSLPNLTYLDLSFNKVDLAYDNAFAELKKLEVLDLSFNNHYFIVPGVTHNIRFLENLPALQVLNLSYNDIFTLTNKVMNSSSLRELQFQHNQLGVMWTEKGNTYHCIFKFLENLRYLDISHNGIENLTAKVFDNFPRNIKTLRISQNLLKDLEWSKLNNFHQLQELDLSYNYLYRVSSNISQNTRSLCRLDLSHNRISQLTDGFIQSAKSLRLLDLSYNKLRTVNGSTFPGGSGNSLEKLYLHGNPYSCTCDLMDFILWLENSDIDIPGMATGVTCMVPSQRKGQSVIFFDIRECIDHQAAFLIYIVCSLFIFWTMSIATVMHLFYWDASYVLYYIKAKLKGYQDLHSEESGYDAFVTYDTDDPLVSDWVLNHLRVHLEDGEEKLSLICLEERDWTPGRAVIDNLTQSIYHSRKTVFVLTESYVKSGRFKMAVYLAHQRLLDDNVDVIVLLLLEPVLQDSHFLRLRRRLCGKSILEWPRNPSAESWFWQCLRTAIQVDNQLMYNKVYARYFTNEKTQPA